MGIVRLGGPEMNSLRFSITDVNMPAIEVYLNKHEVCENYIFF